MDGFFDEHRDVAERERMIHVLMVAATVTWVATVVSVGFSL